MLRQLHNTTTKSNNHPSSLMDYLLFLNAPYFLHGHLTHFFLQLPLMNRHRLQPSLNIRRSLSIRALYTSVQHVADLSHGRVI
jgi:hypothetical protein